MRVCQAAVYSGSSTESGQPVLSPPPILDALTQLDTMLKRLESAVMDIMKDVDRKRKVWPECACVKYTGTRSVVIIWD